MKNTCTAFSGARRIASGDLREVALAAKAEMDRDKWAQVLIFDDETSNPVEVDFRDDATPPIPQEETRRPG